MLQKLIKSAIEAEPEAIVLFYQASRVDGKASRPSSTNATFRMAGVSELAKKPILFTS